MARCWDFWGCFSPSRSLAPVRGLTSGGISSLKRPMPSGPPIAAWTCFLIRVGLRCRNSFAIIWMRGSTCTGNSRTGAAAGDELASSIRLQDEIWRQAVAGLREEGVLPSGTVVLLPALTAMIDITTTRTMATQLHPPMVIFVMLFTLALISALLSGYGMAAGNSRSWLHMICFAFIISISVYVILDLEYPRLGLIRVDAFDQALVDLRNQIAE